MRISLTYPSAVIAIPHPSRTRKLVLGTEDFVLDIPEYRSDEIVTAVSFRGREVREAAYPDRKAVYRVGDAYFKQAEGLSAKILAERDTSAVTDYFKRTVIGAVCDWMNRNQPLDMKRHPDVANSLSVLNPEYTMPKLSPLDYEKLKDIDVEARQGFEQHMEDTFASMLLVDGIPYRRCAEPSYVISAYISEPPTFAVSILTDELPPPRSADIALFPLGHHEEARAFAEKLAVQVNGRVSDILHDLTDCGINIRADHETRSLVTVGRTACLLFRDTYVSEYDAHARGSELLESVSLESIGIYRNLKEVLSAYENTGEIDADRLARLLEGAAACESARVFTGGFNIPIKDVVELWDDRTVTLTVPSIGIR